MQTATLSTETQNLPISGESTIAIVNYFHSNGELIEIPFQLANHEDRVRLTKLCVWATRKRVELRLRTAS